MHRKPDLESESYVTEAANRTLTAVHDHNGDSPQMLLAAIRLVERIRPRMGLQNQGTTGVLPSRGIRHDHRFAATVLGHGQGHGGLAGYALPLDIPICGIELSLLVEEDLLGQWRQGDVVTPAQCHLDLAHGRFDHHRQPAGGWCPTLAGGRLVVRRIIRGSTAANFRICAFILTEKRITDIFDDLCFFSCSVWRRRKEASEVPAGGIVCQPLVVKVKVRWVRSNKIAAENIDKSATDCVGGG
jgi:hypothetical protein